MKAILSLLGTVLVAIGIGIGAEAIAGPTVYGPVGAQFTAAFPAAPTVKPIVIPGGVGYGYDGELPDDEALDVSVARLPVTGWVGYAPLPGTSGSSAVVFVWTPSPYGSKPVSLRQTALDGERVMLGVACAGGRCAASMAGLNRVVGKHLVMWQATAFAPTNGGVRALLSSVAPISGTVPSPPRRVSAR